MKTSIAVLVLAVSVGTVYAQSLRPAPAPEGIPLPNVPGLQPMAAAPAEPKERTINQLLDEIQTVRAQKAELAKREQSLMAEVRKLVEQQNERLTKMGLGAPVQPPPAAVDFALPVIPGSVTPTGPAQLPPPNR